MNRRHDDSTEAERGENPPPRSELGSGDANCTGPRTPQSDDVMREPGSAQQAGKLSRRTLCESREGPVRATGQKPEVAQETSTEAMHG